MRLTQCHNCGRSKTKLSNLNCGHAICFPCMKTHKTNRKCIECLQGKPQRLGTPSPPKHHTRSNHNYSQEKERSTRVKDNNSHTEFL